MQLQPEHGTNRGTLTCHAIDDPGRLSALTNIYVQLAAQFEDQAVALIAFSVWSGNRDLVLADLFSRISMRRSGKKAGSAHVQEIQNKLKDGSNKRVGVDTATFFREVERMRDPEIVRFFLGYWRKKPSVKLVPPDNEFWKSLPGELRRMARSFYEEHEVPRLTAGYNKLKHGPQLVVRSPRERAERFAAGDVAQQIARNEFVDRPTVRLLLARRALPHQCLQGLASSATTLISNTDATGHAPVPCASAQRTGCENS